MSVGTWFMRRGRLSRQAWWLQYFLPLVALFLLAAAVDMALGYPGLAIGDPGTEYAITGGPFEVWVWLVMTVPLISSTVARLHDRGLSARWLWWWLVPVIGFLVTVVPSGFLAGQLGPNRYGPPPRGRSKPVPA